MRVANRFISYMVSCLRLNTFEVLGFKIFLHPKDFFSSTKDYELIDIELATTKKIIKRGDVVLVIGAYVGFFTLFFAKLVGEEGKVFAFEPEPTNFSLLQENIEMNGYNKNVVLVKKAISNKTGKIKLYISEIGSTDHRIYDFHSNRRFIEIESIRLDDYFKDDEKIDFIKIDIQGAELMALQGMSDLLNKNKDIKIVTEFSPTLLEKSGFKPEEYLKSLVLYGFKLYDVDEKKKELRLVKIPELLETYTPEKGNYTNLLCIKEPIVFM